MVERREGEESLPVFVVPGVPESDVDVPHALPHVDVLVPVISLMTETTGPQTDLGEPPEGLPGEDVAGPAREVSSKHFEMMPEVYWLAGTEVL